MRIRTIKRDVREWKRKKWFSVFTLKERKRIEERVTRKASIHALSNKKQQTKRTKNDGSILENNQVFSHLKMSIGL